MFFSVFRRKTLKALQNRCFLAENVKKLYKIDVFFQKTFKKQAKIEVFPAVVWKATILEATP